MAAQTLLLMDLSKKDKEEAAMPRGSKEVSGSTAMLKKPLYILMVFSLLMVGIALWLG